MASRVTRSLFSHHHSISTVKRLISRSSNEAKKRLYDVSMRRYFGTGFGVEEITRNKGQMHSLASINSRFAYQLNGSCKTALPTSSFYRSFASSSSAEPPRQQQDQQNKKDITTREDPFVPTYHIPPKPVTYTEGGFYSIVILAGLGVAGFAAYAAVNELFFDPKEYKIFNKALNRIQNDSQVRVRIGSPITGYGQESRNRRVRQMIPKNIWTDEEGVEHVEVSFWVRGPQGKGQVSCHMFKDKDDKQWKYMYLIVNIHSPTRQQLMLESFLPA